MVYAFVAAGWSSLRFLSNTTIGLPQRAQREYRSQPSPAVTTSSLSLITFLQRSHLVTSMCERLMFLGLLRAS